MSHFSTLKTELRDRDALIQALEDLGHQPEPGQRPIRGYRGQTEVADLAIVPQEGGDIGFRWDAATGQYELVTDLDLWRQAVPVERFLAQLTQRYALRTILAASEAEGFQVQQQIQTVDGSIELVVSRWDG